MAEPLRVVATIHCKPGTGGEAADAMRVCVRESRKEAGCIEYAAYRTPDMPDRMTVVELWESAAALEQHNKTPHFKALIGVVGPLAAAPIEVLVLNEIR
ncbi:antibiotic biosynthesis monooxygenase [Acetobacteraceae bacterium KSS8]|uniref:Antibiotic biosynthesis monooxygenase n=1 Tax=Endosaccharibacter trunci TaxID=2812733 RepID=A0ABT1W8J1_9PROT|nr:antibiotic biosynthesis monooxygenase [Acetobacteraceae bacterium KSS8]